MSESRFYRHYKNKPYKYLGLVRHSETLEELVLYETLYENQNGRIWVRPKDMFFEKIEKNNQWIHRFQPTDFKIQEFEVLDSRQKEIIKELAMQILGRFDQEKFERKLQVFPRRYVLIAYDAEKPVAFKIGYGLDANIFYSWYGGVLPEYRKLGLGTLLMKRQHEWCRHKNFRKIKTKSTNSKIEMINLNLKLGLQIVGVETKSEGELKILFEKIIV